MQKSLFSDHSELQGLKFKDTKQSWEQDDWTEHRKTEKTFHHWTQESL